MATYAIAYKNWVELRSASKEPKQVVSEVRIPYSKRSKRKYSIKVTAYIGGRVLRCVKAGVFASGIGNYGFIEGSILKLTPEQLKRLRNYESMRRRIMRRLHTGRPW